MSANQVSNYGCDDGFNTTILYTERAEVIIRPSRVRFGRVTSVQFAGASDDAPRQYETEEGVFSVNAETSESTVHDDYPFSGANRVLIHDALHQVKYKDIEKSVSICTGLPLKRYFKNSGELNKDVIERKMQNVAKPVQPVGGAAITIDRNNVAPEALSAIFDLAITERRPSNEPRKLNPVVKEHKEIMKSHVAFVDIGGRTSDIAIWTGGNLEKSDIDTINAGMEDIYRSIEEAVCDEFALASLPHSLIVGAFKSKSIAIGGRTHSIERIIEDAVQLTVERIRNQISGVIGSKGKLLNQVAFLGGGAAELYHYGLSDMYDNQVLMENPIVVNARALYKFQRYING